MSFHETLAIVCLSYAGLCWLIAASWPRRRRNRRRPGVLKAPSDLCQRNRTEAVP